MAAKSIKTTQKNKSTPRRKVKPVSSKTKDKFYIIGIGASAGGLNAVSELLLQLNEKINAAIFVVLHLSKAAIGQVVVDKLKKNSIMRVSLALDGEFIEPGRIYVAPPDQHLLVDAGKIIMGNGPGENRFRPSIDVMFRSLASEYNSRVIGIILTGLLNDGTSGMWAIKKSGGCCIVQDPKEAEYPDMPVSVMEMLDVDYSVNLANMGQLISDLCAKEPPPEGTTPAVVIAESRLSKRSAVSIPDVAALGDKSFFNCPDCGGALWSINYGDMTHYRCHIGHSYTERDLLIKQGEAVEHSLWIALRTMEERRVFLMKIARENYSKGLVSLGKRYQEESELLQAHIERIKQLLIEISLSSPKQ